MEDSFKNLQINSPEQNQNDTQQIDLSHPSELRQEEAKEHQAEEIQFVNADSQVAAEPLQYQHPIQKKENLKEDQQRGYEPQQQFEQILNSLKDKDQQLNLQDRSISVYKDEIRQLKKEIDGLLRNKTNYSQQIQIDFIRNNYLDQIHSFQFQAEEAKQQLQRKIEENHQHKVLNPIVQLNSAIRVSTSAQELIQNMEFHIKNLENDNVTLIKENESIILELKHEVFRAKQLDQEILALQGKHIRLAEEFKNLRQQNNIFEEDLTMLQQMNRESMISLESERNLVRELRLQIQKTNNRENVLGLNECSDLGQLLKKSEFQNEILVQENYKQNKIIESLQLENQVLQQEKQIQQDKQWQQERSSINQQKQSLVGQTGGDLRKIIDQKDLQINDLQQKVIKLQQAIQKNNQDHESTYDRLKLINETERKQLIAEIENLKSLVDIQKRDLQQEKQNASLISKRPIDYQSIGQEPIAQYWKKQYEQLERQTSKELLIQQDNADLEIKEIQKRRTLENYQNQSEKKRLLQIIDQQQIENEGLRFNQSVTGQQVAVQDSQLKILDYENRYLREKTNSLEKERRVDMIRQKQTFDVELQKLKQLNDEKISRLTCNILDLEDALVQKDLRINYHRLRNPT